MCMSEFAEIMRTGLGFIKEATVAPSGPLSYSHWDKITNNAPRERYAMVRGGNPRVVSPQGVQKVRSFVGTQLQKGKEAVRSYIDPQGQQAQSRADIQRTMSEGAQSMG